MKVIRDKKLLSMWEGDYYEAVNNNRLENKGQPISIVIDNNSLYLRCVGGMVKSPAQIKKGMDIELIYYQTPVNGLWEVVDIVQ